jgi:threonine aldolase
LRPLARQGAAISLNATIIDHMFKHSFFNDYSEGAHPSILELLARSNLAQEDGYGNDALCREAADMLKQIIQNQQAAVHFIPGGTQTNLIALAALLKPYESVISANTWHIHVHEAGAVEATGHKINVVPSPDGKLTADQVQQVVDQHTDEHMVKPRVVFISNSTEVGTAYRKAELEQLARVCQQNHLVLYMDGARLGSAICSQGSDVSMPELARLVDMFYLGGTKNGALLGEALVIVNPALQADFRYHLKQHGAMLAKGRILGAQFVGLLRDGLYFELAKQANAMAGKMAQGLTEAGFDFLAPSTTNQIFPILPDALIAELQKLYGFYVWCPVSAGLSAVRLVTSWATPEDKVTEFINDLRQLSATRR